MGNDLMEALNRAEIRLAKLLDDADGWQSLDVNYEPPHVERLWRPFEDDLRIYLHRIHPCDKALFHPHPWPSAVLVVSGYYEMGVGYGVGNEEPPVAATMILTEGSAYTMTEPNGWHYVKPLTGPSLSVMLTGKPWDRWSPTPDFKLGPLAGSVRDELLNEFKQHFT